MPFVFQVAKFVLNHSELKTDNSSNYDFDELEATSLVTNEYAPVLLGVAQQYFTKLYSLDLLPDSKLLMEYLEKVLSIKEEAPEHVSDVLKKIFKDAKSLLLCKKNIKALIQVLIIAYNQVVISQKNGSYETEASQIKYIELVKNRLYVMSYIVGMFPSFFHENSDFEEDRISLFSSLFEDVGVQLSNIAYGLYYRKYINPQNFTKLERFFHLAAGVGETFGRGICLGLQQTSPTELSRLVPAFDYLMTKTHYIAALAFALGDDNLAHSHLQETQKNNEDVEIIFGAMRPNRDVFFKSILQKQSENEIMFNLDNPFHRYRKMCSEILKATQVVQAPSMIQSNKFVEEQNLVTCFEELLTVKSLMNAPIILIKKSLVLVHSALEKLDVSLAVLVAANQIMQELERLFEQEQANPMLVRVQYYLNESKVKLSGRITNIYKGLASPPLPSSIQEENRASTALRANFEVAIQPETIVKGILLPQPARIPSKVSKKISDKQFQEKLDKIKEECALAKCGLEQVQKDLEKTRIECQSVNTLLKEKEAQEQVFQSQITPLQVELDQLNAEGAELDKKLKTILNERAKPILQKDLKMLQEKAQHQIVAHKNIIEDLQHNHTLQLESLETEIQKTQTGLNVLQHKEKEQNNNHKKQLEDLNNSHKKQIDERGGALKEKPSQIQKESQLLQNELETLKKRADTQTKAYEDEIAQLEKSHQIRLEQVKSNSGKLAQESVTSGLKEQVLKIEADNKKLALALEQSKKLNSEQHRMSEAQYQLLCSTHLLQNQSSDTKINLLGVALEQIGKQLKSAELCMKVSRVGYLEFSGDLSAQLNQSPFLLKEFLSLYLQLHKPACESDYIIIRQSLAHLLCTKELGSYLGIFSAMLKHRVPSYSFKKAYDIGVMTQLVPLKWPLLTDGIIQTWLSFVNMKVQNISMPINPYFVLNLILVAPYYALAQTKPTVCINEIIEEIADSLIEHLYNLNGADKVLLKKNIQIGLQSVSIEFQQWAHPGNDSWFMTPAPLLISNRPGSVIEGASIHTSSKNLRKNTSN